MKNENKLPNDLKWSRYTLLKQIPIMTGYDADDNGVVSLEYNKKTEKYDKKEICEAFTISMINTDRNTDEEVTEIQFVNYAKGYAEVKSLQIPTSLLTETEGIKALEAKGFTIANIPGYKKFVALLKMSLNKLTRNGIENENTKRFYGSRHYGFELIDGDYNYDNFIGIDSPIIPDTSFAELDKVLFAKKGTLEDEIKYLDWVSKDSKCEVIYKQTIACALMGITKIYLGKTVDNPVVEIISPSSSGKGFLDHIVQKCWGRISDEKGLSVSSKSSAAGLAPFNDHNYVLPTIIADITDFIKKYGIEAAGSLVYEHTNSNNTIKAQSDRQISKFNYSWKNVLLMFAEKEDLMQQKDGVSSRLVHLKTNLRRAINGTKGEKVSERDFVEIDKKQHESYGIIGPMFVAGMRKYYDEDHPIRQEFGEVMAEYEKVLKTTSKNAAIYALIEYTYNLAYDFGLLPERWGKMTVKENLSNYEMADEISTDEELYNLMRDRILTQTSTYIDIKTKLSQEQYESREENGHAVRGRIAITPDMKYKIAIIPKDIFSQNVADLIKRHNLPAMKVNPKNWAENGWFLPRDNGRTDHDGTNITREFNRNDPKKRQQERCYWLILQNLEEAVEAEDDLNSVNVPTENLMNIPDGIDLVQSA